MFNEIINKLDLKYLDWLNNLKAISVNELQQELINCLHNISTKVSMVKNFNYILKNQIIISYIFKSNYDNYCQSLYNFMKKYFKYIFKNEFCYNFKNNEYYYFNSNKNENLYKYDIIFYSIKLIKYYDKLKIFENINNKYYYLKWFNLFFKYNLIKLNDESILKMLFLFVKDYIKDIEDLKINNYILVKYELIKFLNFLVLEALNYIEIYDKKGLINKVFIWELISKIGNCYRLFSINEDSLEYIILLKLKIFKKKMNLIILLFTSNIFLNKFFNIILKFLYNNSDLEKYLDSIHYEDTIDYNQFIINENQKIYLLKYDIEKILDNELIINKIINQITNILDNNFSLFIFLNLFNEFKKKLFIIKEKYKVKVIYLYYKLFNKPEFDLAIFSIFFDNFHSLILDFKTIQDYISNYYYFLGFYDFIKNKKIEIINNKFLYNKIKTIIITINDKLTDINNDDIFIIDFNYFRNLYNFSELNKIICNGNYDILIDKIKLISEKNKNYDENYWITNLFKKIIIEYLFKIFFIWELYLPLNWDNNLKSILNIDYYNNFFPKLFNYHKNYKVKDSFIESIQYSYLNKLKLYIINKISLKYENILFHDEKLEDFKTYIDFLYKWNEIKTLDQELILSYLEPLINKISYFLNKYIEIDNNKGEEIYKDLYKLLWIRNNKKVNLDNISYIAAFNEVKSTYNFNKTKKIYTVKLDQYFLIYNTDLDQGLKHILKNKDHYKNIVSLFLINNFENIKYNNVTNKYFLILIEIFKNPFITEINDHLIERIVSSGLLEFYLNYYFNMIKFLKSTNNYNSYYKIQLNMFIIINKMFIKLSNLNNYKIIEIISEYTVKIFLFIIKSYYYKFIEEKMLIEFLIINEEFNKIIKEFFKFLKISLNFNDSYKILFVKNLNIDYDFIKIVFKNYKINNYYKFNLLKNEILQCFWYLSLTKNDIVLNYLGFNLIPFDLFNTSCYSIKEFYLNKSSNNKFYKNFKKIIKTIKFTLSNKLVDDKFKISYNTLEQKYIYYSDQKIKFKDLLNISSTLSFKKEKTNFKGFKNKFNEEKINWINYHSSNLNISIYSFIILLNMKNKSSNIKNFFEVSEKLHSIKISNNNIKSIFYKNIKNFNIKNDPNLSIYNKTSIYKFLKEFIISIEIIDEERHYKIINFMKPNICFFYTNYIKNKFLKDYDISSRENRWYSLLQYFEIFEIYSRSNKLFYKYLGFIFRLKEKEKFITFGIYFIWYICLANNLIFFLFSKIILNNAKLAFNKEITFNAELFDTEDFNFKLKFITNFNYSIFGLSLWFLCEFFITQFYYNYKIQLKNFEKNNSHILYKGYFYKIYKFFNVVILRTIFLNDKFIALFLHLFFSSFWFFEHSKITIFTVTLHLYTIIFISDILKKTWKSIFTEIFKILIVFIFIFIVLILFSYIWFFTEIVSEFKHSRYCKNLIDCFYFNLRYSFFDNSGIYSYINIIKLGNSIYEFISIYQIIFFIISKVVIGNIIQAIILDSFSLSINQLNIRNLLNENECFICSITKENYNSKKNNLHDHIKNKHFLENYFYYYIFLSQKNKKYFSKTEKYVYNCILNKKIDFFPLRNIKNENELPESN